MSGQPARALVVEDDPGVAGMLRRHLTRAGMIVHEAATERDAVRRAEEVAPDVVILDLTLREGTGAGVCERVRELPSVGDVPILVLTARDDLLSKVGLFALGGDDYMVKPCEPAELLARVQALMRRGSGARATKRVGPLRVALATGDAWLGEAQLELTAGERAILVGLARAYPAVAPRESLERTRLRERETTSNVVEVLVARLRRKLEDAGGGVTIRGLRRSGYQLRVIGGEVLA